MNKVQEKTIEITKHAALRMKHRLGVKSGSEQLSVTAKAYEQGLRLQSATGVAREYIQSYVKLEPEYLDTTLVLYRDRIFVFEDMRLVTVLPYDGMYCKRLQAERARLHGKSTANYKQQAVA